MRRMYPFFILFVAGCVSPTSNNPVLDNNTDYAGTYRSGAEVLQRRYLYLQFETSGEFSLWFGEASGGGANKPDPASTNFFIDIASTNVTGEDPSYSFKNQRAYGTFTFVSSNRVKVSFHTVFEPYYSVKEPMSCFRQ